MDLFSFFYCAPVSTPQVHCQAWNWRLVCTVPQWHTVENRADGLPPSLGRPTIQQHVGALPFAERNKT